MDIKFIIHKIKGNIMARQTDILAQFIANEILLSPSDYDDLILYTNYYCEFEDSEIVIRQTILELLGSNMLKASGYDINHMCHYRKLYHVLLNDLGANLTIKIFQQCPKNKLEKIVIDLTNISCEGVANYTVFNINEVATLSKEYQIINKLLETFDFSKTTLKTMSLTILTMFNDYKKSFINLSEKDKLSAVEEGHLFRLQFYPKLEKFLGVKIEVDNDMKTYDKLIETLKKTT